MAPKLPGKFDDIAKTASSILGDDYQVKGYKFEAKAKTNLDGAMATVTVEPAMKESVKTPAKLSWKFPKPFGIAGFAVNKLEYAKDGKTQLECSMTKDMHSVDALTVDLKHDLVSSDSATAVFNYTGLPDAMVKFETKPYKLADFGTLECLYGTGSTIVGAKFTGLKIPDVGVSFASGPFFGALVAKKELSEFTKHVYYKVSDDVKVVVSGTASTKSIDKWAVGGIMAGGQLGKIGVSEARAKLESGMKLSAGMKKELAKGLTVVGGGCYDISSGGFTYGVKMNVE